MKTVQRSPRHDGAGDRRASVANSSRIEMPSRSACSSRKEPVPAAQALFIAKSTTTPRSMPDVLAVLPADLEHGVHVGVDRHRRAGLGRDLVAHRRPRRRTRRSGGARSRWRPPRGPRPAPPISCPTWASASRTASSGCPAVGQVAPRDDAVLLVDEHDVGADRADVHTQVHGRGPVRRPPRRSRRSSRGAGAGRAPGGCPRRHSRREARPRARRSRGTGAPVLRGARRAPRAPPRSPP